MSFSYPFSYPLLIIDTAGDQLAMAVARDDNNITPLVVPMVHGQAETLIPTLDDFLRRQGLVARDLKTIITTLGPGSFTGVRVGVAAARALGYAGGQQVFGIGSLWALLLAHLYRHRYDEDKKLLLLADSRRVEIFYQVFHFFAAGKDSMVGQGRQKRLAGSESLEESVGLGGRGDAGESVAAVTAEPLMKSEEALRAEYEGYLWVRGNVDLVDLFLALSWWGQERLSGVLQVGAAVRPLYARLPDTGKSKTAIEK